MQQTRHRSTAVLRGYVRRGGLFLDNAASKVGCRWLPFSPGPPSLWRDRQRPRQVRGSRRSASLANQLAPIGSSASLKS
jgi:hypothetical protein